jgi:restriction endonuclease S subunit
MTTTVLESELEGKRWDPGYWDPRYVNPLKKCKLEIAPLGDFIEFLTYGPIVTGKYPKNVKEGVIIINQGEIEFTGVDLTDAITVKENSVFDPQRCRLQKYDLVFPRSGVASLGKNKVTIFEDDYKGTVGCFVDIIRIKQMNPYYVVVFLKCKYGWHQIFRIINGVGTPNISFDEIRDIKIPIIEEKLQKSIEKEYQTKVSKVHYEAMKRKEEGKMIDFEEMILIASENLKTLVKQVEEIIEGKRINISTI